MSDRNLSLYLRDIVESATAIQEYTAELDISAFVADRKTCSAVVREFEIIGEASKYIPQELRLDHAHIAWRDIIDFRNLLIHQYFGVDFEIVWKVIQNDLPPLICAVNEMIHKRQK